MSGDLDRRVARVSDALRAHAGGIELREHRSDGTVVLRFTGMCTACPFRPLTMAATVRPALESMPGVTAVEAQGTRISDEAQARLAAAFAGHTRLGPLPPVERGVP